MPEPVTIVVGPAAPLLLPDVDTDLLAPTHGGRGDPGASAFAPLRYRPDGTEDPTFVLNQAPFRGAPILLAGRNFGCGSSREWAVRALMALGVRCVIAPSFGDIFAGNCVQNGVVPAQLEEPELRALAQEAADGAAVQVDLRSCSVTTSVGHRFTFVLDATWRDRLLVGLDDVTATLRQVDAIVAFESADRRRRPWIYAGLEQGAQP